MAYLNTMKFLSVAAMVISLNINGVKPAQAEPRTRSCTVIKTEQKDGNFYIWCSVGAPEGMILLGIIQPKYEVKVRKEEQISFLDPEPPLSLKAMRAMGSGTRILWVKEVSGSGSPGAETGNASSSYNEANTYSETDDTGAIVFTDDPSKLHKKDAKRKKR